MNRCSFSLGATIAVISMLVSPALSFAQAQPPRDPCPELPGDASTWKEQEHWAWNAICEGRNADLQAKYGGSRNTRDAQNWPTQRDLSQRFLETILTDDSYRSRIPNRGIVIVGARFRESLNFVNAQLEHDLSLIGSRFEGKLNMRGLEAQGSLVLRDGVFGAPGLDEAINLSGGARIHGNLDLTNADTQNHVNMDSLHVAELSMNSVYFPSLWLATAKIDSQLSLNDSAVAGQVQMTNLEVGKDLNVLNSYLIEVILRSAKIGGTLAIAGPKSGDDPPCRKRTGPRPTYPSQSVDLTQATIGTLNFGGVCYGPINAPENWGAGAHLSLTDASVRTLQDGLCRDNESECSDDTWPDHLELTGFIYQQLESFDAGKESDLAARPAEWWIGWLKRQAKYSPQPYETLAATLSRLGHKEKARDILYAEKNRELLEATPSWAAKIWLGLHWLLIGYGYRTYYALWWALAFVVAGVAVLRLSGEGKRNCMPFGIAYSIDMLLPIIHLRDAHYKIDLNGWARYYFYIHKTMGYVLASFLIAGLSGLTR